MRKPSVLLTALFLLAAAPADDLDAWLVEHAVPVRSIDIADDDFSDLEPLVEAIGDARIVQLGESSHGAGAAFETKARLIRFLHERMDFDVLVWESGMYDVRQVDEALRAGVDPAIAGREGIFSLWTGTAEVIPLVEYAQASHATDAPLTMAGFDMQFSGAYGGYADDLEAFLGALPEGETRDRLVRLGAELVAGYETFQGVQRARGERTRELRAEGLQGAELVAEVQRWTSEHRDELAPDAADLAAFQRTGDDLLAAIDDAAVALRTVHAPREVAFWRRTIENLLLFGQTTWERNSVDAPDSGDERRALNNRGWNRRDTRNAANLLWLADHYFAGRKLIVWAHNGHVMNAYYAADWSALSHEPQEGGMKPTGVFLEEALGDEVYTIGLTAHEGRHKMQFGDNSRPVGPAPEGSLEERLSRLESPHLFLDLRSLDTQPDHPLRRPFTMAIRGYQPETMDDWTRVVDGVFFNAVMTPSTPVPRPE